MVRWYWIILISTDQVTRYDQFLANYDNKEGKRKHYISLILVFNVVKTSVYSENGK